MSVRASLLPLAEEVYLRSLTGRLVGEHLFDGFRRVAVIILPDRICSALAAAALSSFTYYSGYRDGVGAVFAYDENIGEAARRIAAGGFEAVFIAYGGEQKLSFVNEAFKATLRALMEAGYNKALIIHVRAWLATKQLSTVLQDEALSRWLSGLPEIRVFTADLNAKKLIFNRLKITNGKPALTPYREALLTDEHVDLLRRSIPPPE
jgi:hypothetical protein